MTRRGEAIVAHLRATGPQTARALARVFGIGASMMGKHLQALHEARRVRLAPAQRTPGARGRWPNRFEAAE